MGGGVEEIKREGGRSGRRSEVKIGVASLRFEVDRLYMFTEYSLLAIWYTLKYSISLYGLSGLSKYHI